MVRLLALLILITALNAAANDSCISCHDDSCTEYRNDYMCASCHGGIPGTNRKALAHYKLTEGKYAGFLTENATVRHGGLLIDSASCRRCHVINEHGTRLASNLDITIQRLTAQQTDNNITAPNEQMPDFHFSPDDIAAIVTALLHYSSKHSQGESLIEIVHFGGNNVAKIYSEKCGCCHRMLAATGALGSHTLAPFLSGLYTEFYPPLDGKRWDKKLLSDWLDNPRKIKATSAMPKPELTREEKEAVLRVFDGEKQ